MLILYVDDDSDDLEFFDYAIKALNPGIPCVTFQNGKALLDYLENSKVTPDFIFIDINMPKMNGYECAREIKARYFKGDVTIVMYSTAFNPADLVKFDEAGFKYIVKQSSLNGLIQSIIMVINPVFHLEERR